MRFGIVTALLAVISVSVTQAFSKSAASRSQFTLAGAPLGSAGLSVPALGGSPYEESSWYCTWSLPTGVSPSSGDIGIYNASSLTSRIGVYSSLQRKPLTQLRVGPWSVLKLPLSSYSKGQRGGVVLLAKDGVTLANLQITQGAQNIQSPCQSSPGFYWLVSGVDSLSGDQGAVSIYNPFSAPAVVDVETLTQQGLSSPGAYQGIIIPPGRTQSIAMSGLFPPASNVSFEIRARSGRIVVSSSVLRQDQFANGLAFQTVTTRPSGYWQFPYVPNPQGSSSTAILTNPSAQEVRVELDLIRYPSPSSLALRLKIARRFIEVAPASVSAVPLSTQFDIASSGSYALRIYVRGGTGIGAGMSSALPSSSGSPTFSEPTPTPLVSSRWLVLEPHSGSVPPALLGKVALSLPDKGSDLVEVSSQRLTTQVTPDALSALPLLPEGGPSQVLDLLRPAVLSAPALNTDALYFVRASQPLAVSPVYSAADSSSFIAVPIRG